MNKIFYLSSFKLFFHLGWNFLQSTSVSCGLVDPVGVLAAAIVVLATAVVVLADAMVVLATAAVVLAAAMVVLVTVVVV